MEIPKTLTVTKIAVAIVTMAVLAISWRLMPHVPNFAPIGAIALVSGTLLSKKHSLLLVLGVMFVTDAIIGFYPGFLWTWLGVALIIPVGLAVKQLPFASKAIVGSIGSSVVFFILSNFGVWVASGMYVPTATGLITCYIMGLPFLSTTLVSDFAFSSALLGLASYLQRTRFVYKLNDARLHRAQALIKEVQFH